jgi:ABC-type transport system substrate-binding protein
MHANFHIYLVVVAIVFSSCTETSYDDSRVFRYNESAGISTLDPAHSRSLELMWVVDALYDGLVELSPELEIVPAIAESWEVDGNTYTFHLRKGVMFQSGKEVNATDVVKSFERLLDPEIASSGGWILEAVENDGIFAVNDSTVIITLSKSFPPFLGLLTTTYASVVDTEGAVDLRVESAGTGPFALAWWVDEVAIVLHKNPLYWEEDSEGVRLPYLDAVHIDMVPDMGSEYMGLIKGRYDFMSGLHPAYMEDLMDSEGGLASKHEGVLRLEKIPFLKTDYLGILVDSNLVNMKDHPLLDSRVRKALSLSVDRKSIAKNLRRNSVEPSDRFIPPSMLRSASGALNLVDVKYDIVEAKRLLVEAGYPGGVGVPDIELGTTADYVDLCSAIQHGWEAIGITVQVDLAASSVQRERVSTSKIEMFHKSWLADYADAENFLGLFRKINFSPGGPNYTHFYSMEFEQIFDSSMKVSNDAQRWEMYSSLDSIIFLNTPIIPLFHDQVTHFVRNEVEGWIMSPVNRLDLRRVKKRAVN